MINNVDRLVVESNISQEWGEMTYHSLIQTLIARFNQERILYCHWKSKSLQGESDIDLLVSNQSFAQATEILMQLGFKAATPKWADSQPGVFHYYGYDAFQDEYVHVHMFTRVLTGDRLIKDHMFPFEEMLFKDTYSIDGLIVTSKEAEFVLFILKTFIRYGSLLYAMREFRGKENTREEFHTIKVGSNMTTILNNLTTYCPVVDEPFFLECIDAVERGARYPRKWILAQKMRWRLRIYRKSGFFGRWLIFTKVMGATLRKKLKRQKGSKILVNGGAIVAIVGADATGKSTLVEETSSWLRNNFVIDTIHTGKPPSTLLTLPINLLLSMNRRVKRRVKSFRNEQNVASAIETEVHTKAEKQKSLFFAVRAVCLAWDRRVLLFRARRAAANGEIVVCDRYPTNIPGMMDSPRLIEKPGNKGLTAFLYNWLARVERNIYRQILPPNIVLRLRVSLENAKKRNAAREIVDDETYLETRHEQVEDWFVTGARHISDIDTNHSLETTIARVKQVVWSNL